MDRTIQDLAWRCLPREFKEEVKKYYDNSPVLGVNAVLLLENLFGIDNLTSDAEGEEMLMVSRKRVQDAFNSSKIIGSSKMSSKMLAGAARMVINALTDLFGSKCLPDEKDCATCQDKTCKNYDTDNRHCCFIENCKYEPKPAEPKFKVGDIVRIKSNAAEYHQGYQNGYAWLPERNKYVGKVFSIINIWTSGTITLNTPDAVYWEAIDLESYTEPKENVNLSQDSANCDKEFDNIPKDSFSKERRLNIAVQMVKAITQCPEIIERIASAEADSLLDDIADDALHLTDRLISKCEKGGFK